MVGASWTRCCRAWAATRNRYMGKVGTAMVIHTKGTAFQSKSAEWLPTVRGLCSRTALTVRLQCGLDGAADSAVFHYVAFGPWEPRDKCAMRQAAMPAVM